MPDLWFKQSDPHVVLAPLAASLRQGIGAERKQLATDALSLYFGNFRNNLSGDVGSLSYYGADPPSANVIQWCTDSLAARLVRNKVRPYYLTEGGDPELQANVQAMQQFIEAEFFNFGLYGIDGIRIAFDGLLFDAGGMKIVPDLNGPRMIGERVFSWNVFTSTRESRLGHPRQLIDTLTLDREVALARYGHDRRTKDAIKDAPSVPFEQTERDDWMLDETSITDQIVLTEAYHLPSGVVDRSKKPAWELGNHDGVRALVIDGVTIDVQAWPFDHFPIAWFKPLPKPVGYWSRSIPETLAGEQMALNRLNARIDGILNLHARPLLLLWKQAKINPRQITNAWATILESAVQPAQAMHHVVPQSIPAELFQQVDRIIQFAEKKLGMSEMTLTAAKPPGVDHEPGMQFLDDAETIRHSPFFRAWEQFHVDAAEITADGLRMLAEKHPNYEAVFGDDQALKRYKWKDIDMGISKTRVRCYPTNLLPQTPGAKVSRVIDMLREGLFTRDMALRAIEYPDTKALMGDLTAFAENIDRRLTALVNGEQYEKHMPHPYLNLEMAKQMSASRINRLEADGVEDTKIEPLRQFFKDCDAELQAVQAQQQPMPPPNAPPGAGAPPPGGAPATAPPPNVG